MTTYPAICLLLTIFLPFSWCSDNGNNERNEKLLSSFQIVRFPNDVCIGSNNRNGTCYTSQECSNKGGTSSGSCADGFGVCCMFLITGCGMQSSENVTAWTTPTTLTESTCGLTICPSSSDICSLRIDFTTFVISGPNTALVPNAVRRRLGTPVIAGQDAYVLHGSTYATNCMTDVFQTTSASVSTNPPAVCGVLTGQHMYVEADVDRCNLLQFSLGDAANNAVTTNRGVTVIVNRNWDMTVSQIECTSAVLPPPGCTKYFFANSGMAELTSYNFQTAAGSTHLAMQHERMCIRRERGNCIGCFAAAAINFQVSARGDVGASYTHPGGCCGYATGLAAIASTMAGNTLNEGLATGAIGHQIGFDCIIIPGAFVPVVFASGNVILAQTPALIKNVLSNAGGANVNANLPSGPQICGNNAGIGAGAITIQTMQEADANSILTAAGRPVADNISVCTRNTPFVLEFMSDDLEGLGNGVAGEIFTAAQGLHKGFTITHSQIGC